MNRNTYAATVMMRITSELAIRLDDVVELLELHERAQGRATIVFEAMQLGLPLLEGKIRGDAVRVEQDPAQRHETTSDTEELF